MTRRDYERLAAALLRARAYVDRAANKVSFIHGIDAAAHDIANEIAANNSKFDRDLFLRNCGVIS